MSDPTGDGIRDGGACWPDVTLTQLEYFGAVAETGSFTAAARRLHVAQSSLSRTVAALERRFGVELAVRDGRGVTLTPAGEAFRAAAQTILEARTAGLERFRRFTDGEAGAVHVATLPSLVRHRLGPTIRRFRERRPGVVFTIGDAPAATIVAQVGTGAADLGIAIHPASSGVLRVEPLFSEPVHLAVPQAHRWAGRRTVTWAELAGETVVTARPDTSVRPLVDAGLRAAGLADLPLFEAGQLVTIGGLVAVGLGVAPLPVSTIACLGPGDELTHMPLVEPVVRRHVTLLSRPDRPLTPAAAEFAALLREAYREEAVDRLE